MSGPSRTDGAADNSKAVILDTNVVLDWLVFRDARVAPLDAAIRAGRLHWLTCTRMLQELEHVLGRAPLNARALDRAALDGAIRRHAQELGAPAPTPARPGLRCSDTDDQIFIELALAHQVPLLLTRDRALLKLARKAAQHGLCISQPERWAKAGALPGSTSPGLQPNTSTSTSTRRPSLHP
jgi:predicted nucleic acid-binding protein